MVHDLACHAATPARTIDAVTAQLFHDRDGMSVIYVVYGGPPLLRLPLAGKPRRIDGLWQTTCFELFVRNLGESYVEMNFSPSGEWAAYAFDAYRTGMSELDIGKMSLLLRAPTIWTDNEFDGPRCFALGSTVGAIDGAPSIALSAVIEEVDGTKSYWALAHAPGPPDFHNPACFIATLPAPDAP